MATYKFPSAMVDNLLIDLAATSCIGGSTLYVRGNNTAVTTLTGYGVTVLTN